MALYHSLRRESQRLWAARTAWFIVACLCLGPIAASAWASMDRAGVESFLESISGANAAGGSKKIVSLLGSDGQAVVDLTALMVDHESLEDTPEGREKLATDQGARRALHAMVTAMGAPEYETGRAALRKGISSALHEERPMAVKAFLIRQLGLIGEDVDAAVVGEFLRLPATRDDAAGALVSFAGERSVDQLRRALSASASESDKGLVTYIHALGESGDRASSEAIARHATDSDARTRVTVYEALGKMGDPDSTQVLIDAFAREQGEMGDRAGAALISLAGHMKVSDRPAMLTRALRAIAERQARAIRIAAMRLLAEQGGQDTINWLAEIAREAPSDVCKEAVLVLVNMSGTPASAAVKELITDGSTQVQMHVIHALAERGARDRAAWVIERLSQASDESVRIAAIEVAPGLAGEGAFRPLTAALATSTASQTETAAIEASLGRLGFEGWANQMVAALRAAPAVAKVPLLHVLVARQVTESSKEVFSLTRSDQAAVRLAAIEAIGELGNDSHIEPLTGQLLSADSTSTTTALRKSLIRLAGRSNDPRGASQVLLGALESADDDAAGALMGVLASIGGGAALDAVVGESQSEVTERQDAAVRALAAWADGGATEPLVLIAGDEERSLVHRVLAVRGAVKLIGDDPRVSEQMRLQQLARLMAAAPRVDEKRLVIGGVKALGDPRGLELVTPLLTDDALRTEAADAVLTLAGLVAKEAESARKALEIIQSTSELETIHDKAQALDATLRGAQ